MQMVNLKKDTGLPGFLMYPIFLKERQDVPDGAKIVYIQLLDRARMSMRNPGWTDEEGNVFLNYTIVSLAEELHKGMSAVKKNLRELETAGLIRRRHMGACRANRIYVLIPKAQNRPVEGRKSGRPVGPKPTANINYMNPTYYTYREGESL